MFTEHLILAQNSSIDRETNSLSVFNILEDITIQVPGEKANIPVQAVLLIKRENETGEIKQDFEIKLIDPNDKVILTQVLPLTMGKDHRRTRVRVNFHALIEMTGEYKVRVESKVSPELEKEIKFYVTFVRQIPTTHTQQ